MKTYKDVAATTLREFAEGAGVYVATATADAAIGVIVDALVQAGADPEMVESFLDSEVVERETDDPWSEGVPMWKVKDAKDAVLSAVEALQRLAESL